MSKLDTKKSEKSIMETTSSNNNSSTSLELNYTNSQPSLDIDMIARDYNSSSSSSYTSLKDLLMISPRGDEARKNSWRDIQLKDPLIQQAAWAYLQPMALENNVDEDKRFIAKLKDKVSGAFGCVTDVVLVIKDWFSEDQIVEHNKEEEIEGGDLN